jgi:glutamate-1-semialdehyde 2,1-aminomutase
MAAGIAALEQLQSGEVYERLEALGARLEAGLNAAAKSVGVSVVTQRIGSMGCLFFTDQPAHNLDDAMRADRARFKKYFHGMLAEGIYFAPSAFEAGFLSNAHTEADVDATIGAAEKVMGKL